MLSMRATLNHHAISTQRCFGFSSRDRRGWTLQRVELASHGETIWAVSALDLPLAASLVLSNSALDLSEVVVPSLPAPNGALVLTSRLRAALALLNSADNVSGTVVASLLAQSALALASRDRRGFGLWRAELVLQSKTILASQEAESRDLSLSSHETTDFAIHIALA